MSPVFRCYEFSGQTGLLRNERHQDARVMSSRMRPCLLVLSQAFEGTARVSTSLTSVRTEADRMVTAHMTPLR
jgi:hypothetical protein